MTKADALKIMKGWSTADFVAAHNRYCEAHCFFDEYIYPMSEFNEMFRDCDPDRLARKIEYGDFHSNHPYLWLDGGAYIRTGSYFEWSEMEGDFTGDLQIYPGELALELIRNKENENG